MKRVLTTLTFALALGTAQAPTSWTQRSQRFLQYLGDRGASRGFGTLKGPGPFTVFAPTDDAFAKIPKDKLDALLKDKAALTKCSPMSCPAR